MQTDLVGRTALVTGSTAGSGRAIAPAPTRTERTVPLGDAFEAFGKFTALGRLPDAEEIARIVVFLASDAAGYVNGVTVDATGGAPALGT